MNDPFVSVDEIKAELKQIEDIGLSFSRNLSLLAQKIKYILSKIESCETLHSAEEYFDLLDKMQGVLARLAFGEEIGIPDRLRKFVSDFDNLEGNKEYIFNEIKSGRYSF